MTGRRKHPRGTAQAILLVAADAVAEAALVAAADGRVSVVRARSTEELVARARAGQPDVILVDLAFDGRAGVTVAATLRLLCPDSTLLLSASREHTALVSRAERFDLGPFLAAGPPWPPTVCSAIIGVALATHSLRHALAPLRLTGGKAATVAAADFSSSVVEYEIDLIQRALHLSGGVVREAARLLRLPEGTLRRKMLKYAVVATASRESRT